MSHDAAYQEQYYEWCRPGRAWGRLADRIVTEIRPRRVLDAGCAFGFLVEALRQREVDAFGLDLSSYAVAQAPPAAKPYCRQGSITEDLGGTYDLIITTEVLEHLPPQEAEPAIANLCAHTPDILFSSTPFDFKDPTHLNVQPPEYWAEQFARHGFYRDVDFDASFLAEWAVRFRKRDEPAHRIVRDYERRFARLAIERNAIRQQAIDLSKELARCRLPLHRRLSLQLKRLARRVWWSFQG